MNTKPDLVIERDSAPCFPEYGAYYSDIDMIYLNSLTPEQREKRTRMLMDKGTFEPPLKLNGDYLDLIERIKSNSKSVLDTIVICA